MRNLSHIPFAPKRWPFFYGYMIAVWTTLGVILSVPGQTIGVSVFTDFLIHNLNVTRFQLSTAYAAGTILSAFTIRRTSLLLDTWGCRIIGFASTFLLGLTLIYLSRVDFIAKSVQPFSSPAINTALRLAVVIIGFFCMRFFGQGMLTLTSRTMLMRWFDRLRGRINSISGVAVSLIFSGSPLFLETMIRRYEWRGAWQIMGLGLIFLFAGLIWIFFRDNPEACGLEQDGQKQKPDQSAHQATEQNWNLFEAKKTPAFRAFNIGLSMFALLLTAVTFHIVSIFQVNGMSRSESVSIFFPASVIAVSVNLVAGWLSDTETVKYRLKYYLIFLLTGLLLVCAGVCALSQPEAKWLIIVGNGMASGIFGTLIAIVWPRYFGRKHLGEIAGCNMAFMVFFSAIGPPIFGASFSIFGNYRIGAGALAVVLAGLILHAFKADRPVLPAA